MPIFAGPTIHIGHPNIGPRLHRQVTPGVLAQGLQLFITILLHSFPPPPINELPLERILPATARQIGVLSNELSTERLAIVVLFLFVLFGDGSSWH